MDKFKAFYTKIITDKAFKAKVDKILGKTALEDATDAQISELSALAKANGIDISVEEAKSYLAGAKSEPNDELLTDEELDMVAGGSFRPPGKGSGGIKKKG